jgi:peptide/nickel transport system permease protein
VPVDDYEVATIAAAIGVAADHNAALGAAARAYVAREHDLGRVADAYVAALETAAGGTAVDDAVIMRVADVQLSFPAILIALLVDGLARAMLPRAHDSLAFYVLVLSIGVSGWVQYARTVRGTTLVEKNKEYVQAARLFGIHPLAIMARHVLPNVLGPVLVIGTIHIATAIITEATLSFLGVGVPPTQPSLGTLIRIGNDFLFSGEWWVTLFPGIALVVMVLAINLLGDWLRDALNPRLRT